MGIEIKEKKTITLTCDHCERTQTGRVYDFTGTPWNELRERNGNRYVACSTMCVVGLVRRNTFIVSGGPINLWKEISTEEVSQ